MMGRKDEILDAVTTTNNLLAIISDNFERIVELLETLLEIQQSGESKSAEVVRRQEPKP